jgi:hypothetical protein
LEGKLQNQSLFFSSGFCCILIPIICFGFGASEQTIDFAKAVQKTKDKGAFLLISNSK